MLWVGEQHYFILHLAFKCGTVENQYNLDEKSIGWVLCVGTQKDELVVAKNFSCPIICELIWLKCFRQIRRYWLKWFHVSTT